MSKWRNLVTVTLLLPNPAQEPAIDGLLTGRLEGGPFIYDVLIDGRRKVKVNLQTANALQELNNKTRVVDIIYGGLYIRRNIRLLQLKSFSIALNAISNFKWACYLTLSLSMAEDRFTKLHR